MTFYVLFLVLQVTGTSGQGFSTLDECNEVRLEALKDIDVLATSECQPVEMTKTTAGAEKT